MFDSSDQTQNGDKDQKHTTGEDPTNNRKICHKSWSSSIHCNSNQDECHQLLTGWTKNNISFTYTSFSSHLFWCEYPKLLEDSVTEKKEDWFWLNLEYRGRGESRME